jgi:Protein of unknown function (DUF3306)
MNEADKFLQNFLKRWSHRKRAEHAQRSAVPEPPSAATERGAAKENDTATADVGAPVPEPPTADLPPLESINALSQVGAFLAPGVPLELAREALRRAWVTDPTIRDFVGIAENQWDFTDPTGPPGFGPLDASPTLRRIIAELTGNDAQEQLTAQPSPARQEKAADALLDKESAVAVTSAPEQPSSAAEVERHCCEQPIAMQREQHTATQNDEGTPDAQPAQRRHGRALPQ